MARVRPNKSPAELVYLLGEVGAYGVNFHDNDLIPINATLADAEIIKRDFSKALADTGLLVPMATTNLFSACSSKTGLFFTTESAGICLAKDHAGHGSGRRNRRENLCLLGWPRRNGNRFYPKSPRSKQAHPRGDEFHVRILDGSEI